MTSVEIDYALFELGPDATAADLKERYRSLVRRWHPDLVAADATLAAEATEKLKAINAAYTRVAVAIGVADPAPPPWIADPLVEFLDLLSTRE